MTDTAYAWEAPGADVNIAAMSPPQLDAALAEFREAELRARLLRGEPQAVKRLHDLERQKVNADQAERIVGSPDLPLPRPGGPNDHGVSARDARVFGEGLLNDGLGADEVAEHYSKRPSVSPEDYPKFKRELDYCCSHPEISKRWLAGDPDVKRYMLRLHMILQNSRPLPPMPTLGIAK